MHDSTRGAGHFLSLFDDAERELDRASERDLDADAVEQAEDALDLARNVGRAHDAHCPQLVELRERLAAKAEAQLDRYRREVYEPMRALAAEEDADRRRLIASRRASPEEWAQLTCTGGRGPERKRVVLRLAGHLLVRDLDPGVVLELMTSWDLTHNTPPLGPNEVERLVRWVCARHAERLEGAAA